MQFSLHLILQTRLQSSDAKLFAMKKSLAEQVRDYIAFKGDGFTPAKLAEAVAGYQRDLPEEKRCKRQNIESLLEKDFSTVRYIIALAKAMGTTAEALSAGVFDPCAVGGSIQEQAAHVAAGPHEAPVGGGEDPDLVIEQFDAGGSMGSGGFNLTDQPPGIIKSWRVTPDWLRLNVPSFTSFQNLAIVTGFGPSMKPMFNPGDPLLVDTGVKVIDHEGVYFFRVGDEGFIKLVQRVPEFNGPGVILRVISKNPDYPAYELSPKNPYFEVLGKVLTVWRSEQF